MKSKIAKNQRRSKVFSEIIEVVNQTSAGRKFNRTQIAHKSLESWTAANFHPSPRVPTAYLFFGSF